MLPFGVTQIEQHRAQQQNAAKLYLPEICRPEFSPFTRSSSSPKHVKLNRQIPELNHAVTLRKQTTGTHSNRQKIQNVRFPCALLVKSPLRAITFLPGSAQYIECDVTYSKQTIAKFLPGATTACPDRTNFDQSRQRW
jgi:hypothetical protein